MNVAAAAAVPQSQFRRAPDLMIDLETLGTGPRAVVLSIGAVAFAPNGQPEEHMPFYRILDRCAQEARGREVDEATWRWWAEQSVEAKLVFDATRQVSVDSALYDLRCLVQDYTVGELELRVWGNGSDFDLTILGSLFRDFGVQVPWKFYNHRCFRTFKNIFGEHFDAAQKYHPRAGHHNALADAEWQATVLQFIWNSRHIPVNSGVF